MWTYGGGEGGGQKASSHTLIREDSELRRGLPFLQNKKNILDMNPLSGEEPYRVTYPGLLLHTEFI